jgi:hypothetical protein
MVKFFSLLFAIIVCVHINTFSQSRDSILRVYNNETIYRVGNKYMKGNNKISYHDLDMEFTTPRTQQMYQKSKRLLSVSRIFNVASIAVIIASVFTKTNVSGSIAFAAGTGVLGLTGIYFQTASSRHLDRAIWENNRDILTGTTQQ